MNLLCPKCDVFVTNWKVHNFQAHRDKRKPSLTAEEVAKYLQMARARYNEDNPRADDSQAAPHQEVYSPNVH